MKHSIRSFLLLCVLCIAGCPDISPTPDAGSAGGIRLDAAKVAVAVGVTAQLTASYTTATTESLSVTWSSSTAAIATVSATGLVTGVAEGSAVVTATTTDGSHAATCAVTVYTHGGLDAGFGTGGIASIPNADGYAMAVQPDGRIVVGGAALGSTESDFLVARFTSSNGSLDATFGTGGVVTTDLGGGSEASECVLAVAIQTDGKIVAVGSSDSNIYLARYTAAGALDATFGSGGTVLVTLPGSMSPSDADWGLAIQSDGKIVIAGGAYDTDSAFVVARYLASGAIDTGFGASGWATYDIVTDDDYATAVAVTSAGVIAAGCATVTAGSCDFALASFDSSGTLDTGYGTGGAVTTDVSGEFDILNAMTQQGDGKVLLAGYSVGASPCRMLVARYSASGSLDTTFGSSGKIVQSITTAEGNDSEARGVAVQSDGKILVAGYVSGDYVVLARYDAGGVLDSSFGTAGIVTMHPGSMTGSADGIALQSDGKILVVGSLTGGSSDSLALLRAWP